MIPPQASRVPLVADALYAAVSTIPKATVLDGPAPKTVMGDVVVVGATGESSFVTSLQLQQGYGISYVETVDVICMVWSSSGSTAMKPRRDRCGDLLEAFAAAVRADLTLGGACDEAIMGEQQEWLQQSSETGAACSVGFSVRVRSTI